MAEYKRPAGLEGRREIPDDEELRKRLEAAGAPTPSDTDEAKNLINNGWSNLGEEGRVGSDLVMHRTQTTPPPAPLSTGDESAESLIAESNAALPPPPATGPASPPPTAEAPAINTSMSPKDVLAKYNAVVRKIAKSGEMPAYEALGPGVDLTQDIKDLKTALGDLDKQKEGEEKEIGKRELYSTIAAQLGKFAAAQYGLKHNVDLSNLKVDMPDYSKDYDRLISKYKGQKADLSDTSSMGMQEKLRASSRTDKISEEKRKYDLERYKANEANRIEALKLEGQGILKGAELDNKEELAKLRQGEKERKAQELGDKGAAAAAALEARTKNAAISSTSKAISEIYKGKGSADDKLARAKLLLAGNKYTSGISPEELDKLATEPGLFGWGTNKKSTEETVSAIAGRLNALAEAPTSGGGGVVTILHKASGKSKQVPADSIEARNAKNNPAFEVK
jgi:hypothetical protein